MKCIEMRESGDADVLYMGTRDIPICGTKEVLIKVFAAGVNRPDIIQRMGNYPPPPGASDVLGLEISGEIVETGSEVRGFQVGDQVCALTNGGGYAEYCVAPAGQCLPIPSGMRMDEAAALPETCFTVWFNLFLQGGLSAGQKLLVHGGTSGIGTTALQMASQLGAEVYTTAGSDEKCQVCLSLGAKRAINYKTEDFVDVIKSETEGRGVNMILDMVGGDYIAKNIKCLSRQGRLINIAYLNGSKAEINFMMVMLKQLQITGSTLRIQPDHIKEEIAKALKETVWPLYEKKEMKAVVHQTFKLEEAADAHKLMESSQHIGKIILTV